MREGKVRFVYVTQLEGAKSQVTEIIDPAKVDGLLLIVHALQ